MALDLALDCKFYQGHRPCKYRRRCFCPHYEPMGFRVLVIKVGALGDVVRTTCLLSTLKRKYPQSHVTWISSAGGVRMLEGHPMIDRLAAFETAAIFALSQQRFDLVVSLDKEAGPAGLCSAVNCPDRRGIALSEWGTVMPSNAACERYFELGLDDELKFDRNSKSYPALIHEALGLEYHGEPYRLPCGDAARAYAQSMFAPWRSQCPGPLIGLNIGAGCTFANKTLSPPRWVELAHELTTRGYGVVLLGGPGESGAGAWIAERVGPGLFHAGCHNSEPQFVAIVDQCDAVVTGDTLALHVAVAREVPVVALFGPTCHQEIDLYGRGREIVSPCTCGPCYRRQCDRHPNCMDAISQDQIVAAVEAACRSVRAAADELAAGAPA